MKKLGLFVILVAFLIAPVANLYAADYNSPSLKSTYEEDFDVMLLDFVIDDNNGAEDILEAITLKNEGTAGSTDIWRMNLWADNGPEGFQGFEIDKKLGEFTRNISIAGWSVDGFAEVIPVGGLRVFVTADIRPLSSQQILQVRTHTLEDLNKNGSYDYGDYGIFVASDNDGPDITLNRYNQYELNNTTLDRLAPRVEFSNLVDGQKIIQGEKFTIEGFAKDRMDGGVKILQVRIDKGAEQGEWLDAQLSEGQDKVYTWKYDWLDLTPGEYHIFVKAEDFALNKIEKGIGSIFVEAEVALEPPVTEAEVSVEKSEFTVNRNLAVRSPKEDTDVYAKVILRNSAGEPLGGKVITVKATRPGKTTELTLMTNPQGESLWYLSSSLDTTAVYTAHVDGKILDQQPSVKYISADLGGSLIKGESSSAVYLLKDSKRYVFPSQAIYNSYYDNFNSVNTISDDELASYSLGGNIKYRIGSLIKIRTVPKVYRVNEDGVLNWIETEEAAKRMYGPNWASFVHDVPDYYFIEYNEGESIK